MYRHIFGETVENLAGGEHYWMAGNFMKYAAAEAKFGPPTAADLPVDSHQLIALCAPRPCFISYGTVEGGDPKWVDARGSFMAGVLASPVYELLGKTGLGTPGNYLTDPMPPVGKLIGGELAWRQHEGGWPRRRVWHWTPRLDPALRCGDVRPTFLDAPSWSLDQRAPRRALAKRTKVGFCNDLTE